MMRSTHIFTVNEITFKVHLNYMFAGTGKDNVAEQAGALTDISGVREGDYVIFYVMEVGFFGIFQIKSGELFLEGLENHYLQNELGRTLSYRVFIEPSEFGVYKKGITEWEAIENPTNIKENSIYNFQWGWIFKKLTGKRGCTTISYDEFELFRCNLYKNNIRLSKSPSYDYDYESRTILNKDECIKYRGKIDQKPKKLNNILKIENENDLRLLFTTSVGKLETLNTVLKPNQYGKVKVITNEIKCSFSNNSIDLMFFTDQDNCLLIELKNNYEIYEQIFTQIFSYARWISGYKLQLKNIYPILIVSEPRLCGKRVNAKYFKYLNKEDQVANMFSPWYKSYLSTVNEFKCRSFALNRVNALQIFSFSLDEQNNLIRFNEL